jgi:cytochrome oxidase Cu insertion factor (SCO1/SenC/PrrC family)
MKKRLVFVLSVMSFSLAYAQLNNKIVIRGYIENPKIIDSITMVVWKHYYADQKRYKVNHKLTKLKLNMPSGYFEFSDTSSVPVYITIGQKFNHFNNIGDGIMNKYIAEPGDSITIFGFGGNSMTFYGKGKEKYECRYALGKKTAFDNHLTSDTTAQLFIINQYKEQLSPFIYDVMYKDIVGNYLTVVANGLLYFNERSDTIKVKEILPIYRQTSQLIEQGSEKSKFFSSGYTSAKIQSAKVESVLTAGRKSTYSLIKERNNGLIREKLVTGYLATYFEQIEKADSLLYDALENVRHPDLIAELTRMQRKITKGSIAYNFSLPDEQGNIRTLDEFRGKVVFIDFWFTGCKACAIYHQKILSPVIATYKNNPAIVFLTINIDAKREQWLESVKSGEYTSPGSINLHTNGKASNHPVLNEYYVSGFPRPLLIDKNGRVFSNSLHELSADIHTFRRILEEALTQK